MENIEKYHFAKTIDEPFQVKVLNDIANISQGIDVFYAHLYGDIPIFNNHMITNIIEYSKLIDKSYHIDYQFQICENGTIITYFNDAKVPSTQNINKKSTITFSGEHYDCIKSWVYNTTFNIDHRTFSFIYDYKLYIYKIKDAYCDAYKNNMFNKSVKDNTYYINVKELINSSVIKPLRVFDISSYKSFIDNNYK